MNNFQSKIEAEQKSKCFICDLPNYEFERQTQAKVNLIHVSFMSLICARVLWITLHMTTICGTMCTTHIILIV